MKSIFTILSVCFISSAFAGNHPHFENFIDQGEVLSQVDGEYTLIMKKKNRLGIKIRTHNFTKADLRKLAIASQILQDVINSAEFEAAVLNFSYKGDRTFHQNNGLSNEEIYEHLLTGAEDIKPEVDHVMDFDLSMYRSWNPWSKVKGYTTPDTLTIFIHSKFYRRSSWTPVDVAANMAHEWVHKMGFGHDYYYNDDRPFSVPYAIGGLVTKVAKKLGYSKL